MPDFRFDRAFSIARNVKAFLNPERDVARGARPDAERRENQAGDMKRARQRAFEQKKEIKSIRRKISQLQNDLRVVKEQRGGSPEGLKMTESKRIIRSKKREIFQLKNELSAAKEGRTAGEPTPGALPEFVVIGAQKGGTTFLYHLLTQHPLVEPAALKELHFFDAHFGEGIEWYRRCFPAPVWKGGRKSITGEATPYYLFHPLTPERMAQVLPEVRLIALLRNPVERAFSHYQKEVRNGRETLKFEEAVKAEETRLRGEIDKMVEDEHYDSFNHRYFTYLSRGIYVEQLLRWSEFFPREQLLVLKSEDFFEYPKDTLQVVLDFLGLPEWEPEGWEVGKKGSYEEMDPRTRRRLEEYFEPHNKRLYDFLGTDFGW